MGSAAIANHALSCHHYGALSSGAGSPRRTSNFKRTLIQTALPQCRTILELRWQASLQDDLMKSSNKAFEKSVTGLTLGWFGSQRLDDFAIATEESVTTVTTNVTEAASKIAPAWVTPSILAFPVLSYVLFTLYRNKVNPSAKLTDWLFGLVAMAILGNLILIATVGVRLY